MAILPVQVARVSNLLRSDVATQSISGDEQQLLQLQDQLSTGLKVNSPSDNPSAAAIIQQLQQTLNVNQGYSSNLTAAQNQLSEADSTLSSVTSLVQQAQSLASANVGSDITSAARQSAATVAQSVYNQVLSLANTQFEGGYLFGGQKSTIPPYVESDGGVKFAGSATALSNAVDASTMLPFSVDGASVFGGVSEQVQGTANLSPTTTDDTPLSNLGGAQGQGVRLGSISINDGAGDPAAAINLSQCATIGDVVNAINSANVGGISAGIAANGQSIDLSGAAGDNISVEEVGGGTTAADLGILQVTGSGSSISGSNLQPLVTAQTPLADLAGGAAMDLSSGMSITNGNTSAVVKFTSPPLPDSPGHPNVQDLLNAINGSGTNVLATINSAGTGINVCNTTQGTQMTIGENGGSTATDLGIRSYSPATLLSSLNNGQGVQTVSGGDMTITPANGQAFNVSLSGCQTVQDVINAINTAGGGSVTAGFATQGNGITLTDNTGSGTLSVTAMNSSAAAADLGLLQSSTTGLIQGSDVNPIEPEGVFGDLMQLQKALQTNDQAGITAAGEALQNDYNQVVLVQGTVGAQEQEVQSRQSNLSTQNTATQTLLSSLQDVDYTTAVTQYETLQTNLQASLQSTAGMLQMSLMEYLPE